ncbi:Cytochrome P450 [Frankia sp. AiPs1]|uniref:cytochrome P450 n=1 Tax=Frankia sp. AiPa1 TaxID=573492 RepID=UPI00202B86AF|nr:cytochrome P450 [Frankia sp. AiPa1]MCL9758092.1 cytochrome P450 [Frankia sp. AiPa1]
MTSTDAPSCPMDPTRDDRKSAVLAAQRVRPEPGAQVVNDFAFGRAVLRAANTRQAGAGAEQLGGADMQYGSVFFLDGEPHKRRRQAIQKFFTPRAISTRHRVVMEKTTDKLLGQLRANGGGQLDEMSYQLAVAVAAEIIGLTNSDQVGMAKRIEATLSGAARQPANPVLRRISKLVTAGHGINFLLRDVRPAIRQRKARRSEDVISHLLDENYPTQSILIECMTYAVAGMVTTREFIVMAAWHMFGNDSLRERFLSSDEADQITLLEEILRLEPVASMLHRAALEDIDAETGSAKKGELIAVHLRAGNVDEQIVGECPFTIDPDRAKRQRGVGSYLSFGDGSHRCPGAQVAMAESRVFLDRLLRVPGITLVREPDITWRDEVMSYELRGAMVSCDQS